MQLARWLGRPFFIRRTVRLRMTLSYGGPVGQHAMAGIPA